MSVQADEKVLAQVRCGYLIVPENRSQPDGRQLRLAVAIARSLSATPRPDAVVLLSGGPGDSFVQGTPRLMNVVMAGLRADRDLIVWDQRGTGHSQPVFCPELSARLRGIETRGLERSALLAQRRQLVTECREAMLRERVDLSQYNTLVSAQDLEDLRRVLGVAQWNLMAVSYGTRDPRRGSRRVDVGRVHARHRARLRQQSVRRRRCPVPEHDRAPSLCHRRQGSCEITTELDASRGRGCTPRHEASVVPHQSGDLCEDDTGCVGGVDCLTIGRILAGLILQGAKRL
jgi:hypothetical protein